MFEGITDSAFNNECKIVKLYTTYMHLALTFEISLSGSSDTNHSSLFSSLLFTEFLTHDRGSEISTILTSLSEKTRKSNHLLMSM